MGTGLVFSCVCGQGDDKNILDLDGDSVNGTMYTYQNSQNYKLKIGEFYVNFTSINQTF